MKRDEKMFLVDKPYISDFLKRTLKESSIPVVKTEIALELDLLNGTNLIDEYQVIEQIRNSNEPIIYTTSENAINWISKNLSFTGLPEKIDLFKNKFKFRELTKSIFPDLFYKKVKTEDLRNIKFDELPLPFIIKPTVGFFSLGVYIVNNSCDWERTIKSIYHEIENGKVLYPEVVMNTKSFIIEQIITGEEFAIDAYYDSEGEPVIMGIHKHIFSSDVDVSDRVYTTSKMIIENNIEEFTEFVGKIGKLAKVKNFPVHIELRRNSEGILLPIEVNPMRFGGWCTTADLTNHAFGFNPYLYYYDQKVPDWSEILKDKEGKLFSIVILDNSTGVKDDEIKSFDYDKLLSKFEKPLELRKIDIKKYPLFGFVFIETREDNFSELEFILHSDLKEFVS
jgi:hypothetical protein